MSILSLPSNLGGGSRYFGAAAPTESPRVEFHGKVDLQKLYGKDSVLLSHQAVEQHMLESNTEFTNSMIQQAHTADVSEALQELFDELEKAGKKAKRHEQAAQKQSSPFQSPVSFIV